MSYHFLCKRGIRPARTEQFLVFRKFADLLGGLKYSMKALAVLSYTKVAHTVYPSDDNTLEEANKQDNSTTSIVVKDLEDIHSPLQKDTDKISDKAMIITCREAVCM